MAGRSTTGLLGAIISVLDRGLNLLGRPRIELQSRDQLVQGEFADVDRGADDLKLNPLQQKIGENRLVQDPSFIDKDFELASDANEANGVPRLAVGDDQGISEVEVIAGLAVPKRKTRWNLELDMTYERGVILIGLVRPGRAAQVQAGQFDKTRSTVVAGR
jgi:hypothetical protein